MERGGLLGWEMGELSPLKRCRVPSCPGPVPSLCGGGGMMPRVKAAPRLLRNMSSYRDRAKPWAPRSPLGLGLRREQGGTLSCQGARRTPLPVSGSTEEQSRTLEFLFGVWFYNYHFLGFLSPITYGSESLFEFSVVF